MADSKPGWVRFWEDRPAVPVVNQGGHDDQGDNHAAPDAHSVEGQIVPVVPPMEYQNGQVTDEVNEARAVPPRQAAIDNQIGQLLDDNQTGQPREDNKAGQPTDDNVGTKDNQYRQGKEDRQVGQAAKDSQTTKDNQNGQATEIGQATENGQATEKGQAAENGQTTENGQAAENGQVADCDEYERLELLTRHTDLLELFNQALLSLGSRLWINTLQDSYRIQMEKLDQTIIDKSIKHQGKLAQIRFTRDMLKDYLSSQSSAAAHPVALPATTDPVSGLAGASTSSGLFGAYGSGYPVIPAPWRPATAQYPPPFVVPGINFPPPRPPHILLPRGLVNHPRAGIPPPLPPNAMANPPAPALPPAPLPRTLVTPQVPIPPSAPMPRTLVTPQVPAPRPAPLPRTLVTPQVPMPPSAPMPRTLVTSQVPEPQPAPLPRTLVTPQVSAPPSAVLPQAIVTPPSTTQSPRAPPPPPTSTHHFMPADARAILEDWYQSNRSCPYPDDDLAQELARRCREPVWRVLRWLSNRRSTDRNTKGFVGRRKKDGYAKK